MSGVRRLQKVKIFFYSRLLNVEVFISTQLHSFSSILFPFPTPSLLLHPPYMPLPHSFSTSSPSLPRPFSTALYLSPPLPHPSLLLPICLNFYHPFPIRSPPIPHSPPFPNSLPTLPLPFPTHSPPLTQPFSTSSPPVQNPSSDHPHPFLAPSQSHPHPFLRHPFATPTPLQPNLFPTPSPL